MSPNLDRDQDDPGSTLDRVWAATQPADLTGDDFARIWAGAERDLARRSTPSLSLRPVAGRTPGPRRARPLLLLGAVLAQAAAILAVAFVLDRPPGPASPPSGPPLARVDEVKIDVDEMLVILIGGPGVDYVRTPPDLGPTLASLDLPTVNPNDQLSHWESLADD